MFYDRLFDDILMSEGVVTHYLPVKNFQGSRQEKGIDVWLALETFELTISKKFDVVVLITADGDYVPLIRKLNTLGTRLMVLSWDFEYFNDEGEKMVTRTSQDLLSEVSYPVAMHEMIDARLRKNDPLIQNLFVKQSTRMLIGSGSSTTTNSVYDGYADGMMDDSDPTEFKISTIRSLKNGYGFINYPPNNLFFHYTSLNDIDFNELQVDDEVKFRIGKNAESKDIAIDVHLEPNQ
ncbi:hypothetical protein GCM10027299_22620 [Larkinella ripae]